MKKITIAVFTDYNDIFAYLKRCEGDVEYIRIRDIEDVRGRRFDGYTVIGSPLMRDLNELISIVKTRTK